MAKPIPKHISDFHNGKHELSMEIKDDVDSILKAIDLDELLSSPSNYLELLGTVFLEKHQEKFIKAYDMGVEHGKKVVKDA